MGSPPLPYYRPDCDHPLSILSPIIDKMKLFVIEASAYCLENSKMIDPRRARREFIVGRRTLTLQNVLPFVNYPERGATARAPQPRPLKSLQGER